VEARRLAAVYEAEASHRAPEKGRGCFVAEKAIY
jgi:hypothetical protein